MNKDMCLTSVFCWWDKTTPYCVANVLKCPARFGAQGERGKWRNMMTGSPLESDKCWFICSLLHTHTHACMHTHNHTHLHTHTHTHKEKRCNWLSMIRLFLDPQTLPLIKILICRTILEAVDWYIMCNICLPPVSCSETQTDTWYLWISPFLTVIMTTCDQQSLNLASSSAGQNL